MSRLIWSPAPDAVSVRQSDHEQYLGGVCGHQARTQGRGTHPDHDGLISGIKPRHRLPLRHSLADQDDVAVDVEGGVGLPGLEPGTAAVDGLLAVVAAVAGAGGLSPVLSGSPEALCQ